MPVAHTFHAGVQTREKIPPLLASSTHTRRTTTYKDIYQKHWWAPSLLGKASCYLTSTASVFSTVNEYPQRCNAAAWISEWQESLPMTVQGNCCIHKHLTLFYCWPLSSSGRTRTHTHKHAWTGETFDFLKYWELPSYQWLGRFMVSGPPRKITNVLEPFTQYIGTLGLLRSWLGQSKVLIPDTNLFLTTNTGNRIKTFDFQSLCL